MKEPIDLDNCFLIKYPETPEVYIYKSEFDKQKLVKGSLSMDVMSDHIKKETKAVLERLGIQIKDGLTEPNLYKLVWDSKMTGDIFMIITLRNDDRFEYRNAYLIVFLDLGEMCLRFKEVDRFFNSRSPDVDKYQLVTYLVYNHIKDRLPDHVPGPMYGAVESNLKH